MRDHCIGPVLLLWLSVHLKIEEKISLTSGRDGGLQNMEILGMITLRVSDDKYGRIRLQINNNDKKGVQLQVISLITDLRIFLRSKFSLDAKCLRTLGVKC